MEYEEYVKQNESIDRVLMRRCYAALIDYIIFYALFFAYAYLFGEVYSYNSFVVNGFGNLFMVFCIWLFIFPFMESVIGFTLGKGFFDLKVVYQDKKDFHFVSSLKRHLLDTIDFLFVGAIAIALVKFTAEHRRLGDLWGNTTVVIDEE